MPVSSRLARSASTLGTAQAQHRERFCVAAGHEPGTALIKRLAGARPPWTDDPILLRHRFTNPYRFSDRVSQYLLQHVQYDQPWPPRTIVFRTLLFKVFNRIGTWESLVREAGQPDPDTFDLPRAERILRRLRDQGQRIYSSAYIVPNPPYGAATKHENHLRMLGAMLENGTIDRLATAGRLPELFAVLREVPSLGPFLAFQYAIDINYSAVTADGEDGFVVAGPGARDGLRKCFAALPTGREDEAILWVTQTQHAHFGRLGIQFPFLAGRPLQPVDCQNLFCEIDKYARASHPHLSVRSGRSRIKQGFAAGPRDPLPEIFIPPKWRLNRKQAPSKTWDPGLLL
jgi:alpha-glutamyl/putrescinyl thymine pyrophosphorylase clade 1